MFDELLKFSKTHSQTVIVALCAIIVVGSIGGGLLIQTLEETISEQKSLSSDRLQLAAARDSNRLMTIEGQQEALTSELGILRARLPELVRHIAMLKEQLSLIPVNNSTYSKELTDARNLLSTLNDDANSMTSALASDDAVRDALGKVESRWQTSPDAAKGGRNASATLVILVIGMTVGFLVGRMGRRRRDAEDVGY